MLHAALICTGLLTAMPADADPVPRDLGAYNALRHKAGKEPQAQVKLALWCEAHGLEPERLRHLAQAVLADPGNATARGLLGLVDFAGRWETPDRISERVRADEVRGARLAEYNGRRDRLEKKERDFQAAVDRMETRGRPAEAYAVRLRANRELAQAHANLGTWCDQNGLKPEALAHFTTAVHLDPSRDASWRRLGYVKRNGRWVNPQQAADDEKEEREQRQAIRHWEPLLRKWKARLDGPTSRRQEAEELLETATDPHAIPAIVRVFSTGSEADEARLVAMLGRIDDPRSSRALADLAVRTAFSSVRTAVIGVLKSRPRRDYASDLVERIRGKIDYAIQPVEGPSSTGALILDTPRVRIIRTYETPPVFLPAESFRGYVGYDANGLPVIAQGRELDQMRGISDPNTLAQKWRVIEERTAQLIAQANVKVQYVQQRIAEDVNQVEMINRQAEADNERVIPVLQIAAGAPADLKDDEEAWHVWWYDTLGYKYQSPSKVTFTEDVSPSFYPPPRITTCFVAGTPVRTLDGPRPIESIRVGDQVLAQVESSGALAFQPVVFVHHNPPGKTLRVSLQGGGSVVCSVYHRFWRAHLGWAMARELKPGDVLRTLGGLARVEKVEPDATQPLYNLDVAKTRTFFAGAKDLLVHDNTLPDHRVQPFDALPVVDVGRAE